MRRPWPTRDCCVIGKNAFKGQIKKKDIRHELNIFNLNNIIRNNRSN
jgi:hypothetical protein